MKGILGREFEDFQVFRRMAAQFRVGGGGLRLGTLFAHDQLARVDADGLMLHQVCEDPRPLDWERNQAVFLLVEFCDQLGPFARKGRHGLKALLA